MPQVTVYIRQGDLDKWKALERKSAFIHKALTGRVRGEPISGMIDNLSPGNIDPRQYKVTLKEIQPDGTEKDVSSQVKPLKTPKEKKRTFSDRVKELDEKFIKPQQLEEAKHSLEMLDRLEAKEAPHVNYLRKKKQ